MEIPVIAEITRIVDLSYAYGQDAAADSNLPVSLFPHTVDAKMVWIKNPNTFSAGSEVMVLFYQAAAREILREGDIVAVLLHTGDNYGKGCLTLTTFNVQKIN